MKNFFQGLALLLMMFGAVYILDRLGSCSEFNSHSHSPAPDFIPAIPLQPSGSFHR